MRRATVFAATLCILFHCLSTVGQEAKKPLTNPDVIEMSKAGLSDSTIILAIQKGPTQFDTSPRALIQLKNQGLSPAVIDAMIQAGTGPITTKAESTTVLSNVSNPMGGGTSITLTTSRVVLIDGNSRIDMKYSTPEARTNSMLKAVVNPFHKARIRTALVGNHAQLRIKNSLPIFEVGIPADANPSDVVALVKLSSKSNRREIETGRGGITGSSTGFRKEDLIATSLEELPAVAQGKKSYRIKPFSVMPPGEYALVYSGAAYYDFGIDRN
ncbi:MAG TPA: hypothetical protein VJM50_08935 [Pyrinomonadaceae bacterium]|nr:hypothetical protein [Pyrinomonadaceae bacterium]